MSSFIKAQNIILRLTEVGSKVGVFTEFTSKLTVISGNAMYYDQRFLGDPLRRLTARQLSKESIYLSDHPSVFYTTENFFVGGQNHFFVFYWLYLEYLLQAEWQFRVIKSVLSTFFYPQLILTKYMLVNNLIFFLNCCPYLLKKLFHLTFVQAAL